MFKIDGVELDLTNLPASVKIQEGGYISKVQGTAMQTLDSYNTMRYEMYTKPVSNAAGVACPKCGKEMQYTDSGTLLLSDPPKMSVRCECGHNDYKVC